MRTKLLLLAIVILTINVKSQTVIDNGPFNGYTFNTATMSSNVITSLLPPVFSSTNNIIATNLAVLEKSYIGTGFEGNYNTINLSFDINQVANSGQNLLVAGYIVHVNLKNGTTTTSTYTLSCREFTSITSVNYNVNATFTNSPSFNNIEIVFEKYSGDKTKYTATLTNLNITGTGHTVGINELHSIKNGQNLKLYPNPSNGNFKF